LGSTELIARNVDRDMVGTIKMGSGSQVVHPAWLRVTHWVNVLAVTLMVMSGWRIYNASPLFQFKFPDSITLGDWLGGALMWHFAAMWILLVNGLMYLGINLLSGRWRGRLLPVRFEEFLRDVVATLKGRLSHQDLTRYNSIQKLAYLSVIADLLLIVLSGLVVWKSVQFPHLRALMGGYDSARVVHFFAMAFLIAFVAVHVTMAALVPRTLLLITRGR
jgi:thiosulfate reductase cytochrome b subunit